MSIASMANAALARRSDFGPDPGPPTGYVAIAKASAAAAPSIPSKAPPPVGGPTPDQVDTASNVLFGYIPTEVLTIYVAVVAALHGAEGSKGADSAPQSGAEMLQGWTTEWVVFWLFLMLTPVVIWVVYASKVKSGGKPIPTTPREWPIWEMVAGSLAYAAWALALPGGPQVPGYTAGLSSVIILITSTALGLMAPLFQRQIDATRNDAK